MKIIITGATGSLGSALVKYFGNSGHEVLAVGKWKTPPQKLLQYATYFQQDILQSFQLPLADVCIHAAAKSGDAGAENDFYQANVIGTRNVLKAIGDCPMLIHVSSSSVYNIAPKLIREEDTLNNNYNLKSPYGKTKFLSEEVVNSGFKGERAMIIRPRALYGPGDMQIIPRILRLVKKEKINRPGTMKIKISMTHYSNLIHAIELFMKSGKKGINLYNVSDESVYQFDEVMRKIINGIYKRELPEKQIPIGLIKILGKLNLAGMTPLLVRSLTNDMVLDISKIKNELGYVQQTDFDSSLPEVLKWMEDVGGVEALKTEDKKLSWG